ncbi:MAG: citrate synthase, partial [Nocardiopsaceae bacterium]|nr:citrate synthase [Nocardiopsaceae bacterium]
MALPSRGLADVVAATTALSDIDGLAGLLSYRGYDINQLAESATFEEVAYLLQRGSPPDTDDLARFGAEIDEGRELGALVTADLGPVAHHQEPMEALRTLVSLASAADPDKDSNAADANLRKAARLTAQQPVLVAAYDAARHGREVPPTDPELSLAGNFLFQLTGTRPGTRAAKILDICL